MSHGTSSNFADAPARFDPLAAIDAWLDESITPAEHAALDAWLAADAARAALLAARARLHRNLLASLSSPAAAPKPDPSPLRAKVRVPGAPTVPAVLHSKFVIGHSTFAAAALLLLAAAAVVIWLGVFNRNSTINNRQSPQAPLATILDTTGGGTLVVNDAIVNPGDEVRSGDIVLDSGTADFRLSNGVTVRLAGTATLTVRDPMNATLLGGAATFDCPPAAAGYTVGLPNGSRVVDLGTRFGVRVDDAGQAQVHVFVGSVELRHPGHPPQRIDAGTGRALAADGSTREIPAAADAFEPAPIRFVHWSFDALTDGRAADSGSGFAGGPFDAVAGATSRGRAGPRLVAGRFAMAVDLDGEDDFLESAFPGVGGRDARTVALWVRVRSGTPASNGRDIVAWGAPDSYFRVQWNWWEPRGSAGLGGLRLHVGGGGAVIGQTDLRDGRWHHVAVVVEPASGSHAPNTERDVRLYVDGVLDAIYRASPNLIDTDIAAPNALPVIVGRSRYDGGMFRGTIDELYIFDAALSAAQVRRLMTDNTPPRSNPTATEPSP